MTNGQWLGFAQNFTGVCCDLVLNSRMFKGALFLALGFFAVCFPVVAQQAKHSGATQHRVATSALTSLEHGFYSQHLPAQRCQRVQRIASISQRTGARVVRRCATGERKRAGSDRDGAARVVSSDVFGSERCRTHAHQETKRRFQFSIANALRPMEKICPVR